MFVTGTQGRLRPLPRRLPSMVPMGQRVEAARPLATICTEVLRYEPRACGFQNGS
jgi:hypothetical protein